MATAPIILVPGYWLGAWAWDEVAGLLRAGGHDVTALTLPGLESSDTDRSRITIADHIEAIASAVRAAGRPVVLAVHSAAGGPAYAASDRHPGLVAAIVYVDSAPAKGALDPGFADVEKPLPSFEELREDGENFDGLTDEHLQRFRARAVPEPGAVLRESVELTNDARRDVPSVIVCTGFPSAEVKAAAEKGYAWVAGLTELTNVTYIDLPTSHWPMWSRPSELAGIISDVSKAHGPGV